MRRQFNASRWIGLQKVLGWQPAGKCFERFDWSKLKCARNISHIFVHFTTWWYRLTVIMPVVASFIEPSWFQSVRCVIDMLQSAYIGNRREYPRSCNGLHKLMRHSAVVVVDHALAGSRLLISQLAAHGNTANTGIVETWLNHFGILGTRHEFARNSGLINTSS